MGKTRTIWQFFRALFPSTWRTLSPDTLFTRSWDTRKTPKICHIFVLSLPVSRSTLPRNAYFFMASPKLPNRPGFALLPWKTQGRERHTVKPLPKNWFWSPPPMIHFPPPPVCSRPVISISLEGTGTDQTNPIF